MTFPESINFFLFNRENSLKIVDFVYDFCLLMAFCIISQQKRVKMPTKKEENPPKKKMVTYRYIFRTNFGLSISYIIIFWGGSRSNGNMGWGGIKNTGNRYDIIYK